MVFMTIFNFLEPGITIIAQAIPMFRLLLVNAKKDSTAVRISSRTVGNKSHVHAEQARTWNSKVLGETCKEPDQELLHVHVNRTIQVSSTTVSGGSGSSDSGDDTPYDGTIRQF